MGQNPWQCFERKSGMRPDWATKEQWKAARGLFRITVLGKNYYILDEPGTRALIKLLKDKKTADATAEALRTIVLALSCQIRSAEVDPASEELVQQINDFMRPVVRHVMAKSMGRLSHPPPQNGRLIEIDAPSEVDAETSP